MYYYHETAADKALAQQAYRNTRKTRKPGITRQAQAKNKIPYEIGKGWPYFKDITQHLKNDDL